MNAERFLEQYEKLSAIVETKQQRIYSLYDRETSITVQSFSERVQSSGSKQKMADATCERLDLKQELENEIVLLEEKRKEIERVLECLPTAEYKVLYKRFIEMKELYIIADEVRKSYSWVSKKKSRGLKHVQEILDEREKR